MKNLLICSVNQNLQESLSTIFDENFNVFCCSPANDPDVTIREFDPDVCFFDREVVRDKDISTLKKVHTLKSNAHIILAYFYYDARNIPEEEINSVVNDVILKPYQFDILIDKINMLSV